MNVGVLGLSDVAKVLAGGFLKHRHQVMMGTRSPAKLTEWTGQYPKGRLAVSRTRRSSVSWSC